MGLVAVYVDGDVVGGQTVFDEKPVVVLQEFLVGRTCPSATSWTFSRHAGSERFRRLSGAKAPSGRVMAPYVDFDGHRQPGRRSTEETTTEPL